MEGNQVYLCPLESQWGVVGILTQAHSLHGDGVCQDAHSQQMNLFRKEWEQNGPNQKSFRLCVTIAKYTGVGILLLQLLFVLV